MIQTPPARHLFVVDLNYIVPLEEIEPLIEGHMAFLERQYSDGVFLASGAKVPRTGGVIIAIADNQQQLEARLHEDPFYKARVAEYRITEFVPSMRADVLEPIIGS